MEEYEDEESARLRREAIAAAAIDNRAFPPTLLFHPPGGRDADTRSVVTGNL